MSWLVISDADGTIVAGSSKARKPRARRGCTIVETPLDWPHGCAWHAGQRGFVDGVAQKDGDPDRELALQRLRSARDLMLAKSDHPPLFERPEVEQPAWRAYRQALRDLPETTDPFDPVWPESPTPVLEGK